MEQPRDKCDKCDEELFVDLTFVNFDKPYPQPTEKYHFCVLCLIEFINYHFVEVDIKVNLDGKK